MLGMMTFTDCGSAFNTFTGGLRLLSGLAATVARPGWACWVCCGSQAEKQTCHTTVQHVRISMLSDFAITAMIVSAGDPTKKVTMAGAQLPAAWKLCYSRL